jgi:uncharacterized protein YjbJ (UPF0337 family)
MGTIGVPKVRLLAGWDTTTAAPARHEPRGKEMHMVPRVSRLYGGVSLRSAKRGGGAVNEDQVKGKAKQAEGQGQESWGDAKDKADDVWEKAKDKLDDLDDKIDEIKDKADRDDDKSEGEVRQGEAGVGRSA